MNMQKWLMIIHNIDKNFKKGSVVIRELDLQLWVNYRFTQNKMINDNTQFSKNNFNQI